MTSEYESQRRASTPNARNTLPVDPCALCGEIKPPVMSHILPESCYKDFYDEKHRLIMLQGSLTNRPKRPSQKGIREPLLCEDCDNGRFGKLDKYFAEEWLQKDRLAGWKIPGTAIRPITGLDYSRFKRFHLSVLFRAHVSRLPEFSQVKLRPYFERKLRKILMTDDPIPDLFFPIAAYAFLDEQGNGILAGPDLTTLNGFRVFSLYYGGCKWLFVEMDANLLPRQSPRSLQTILGIRLQTNGQMRILCDDWRNSKPIREICS